MRENENKTNKKYSVDPMHPFDFTLHPFEIIPYQSNSRTCIFMYNIFNLCG